ncbi:MAG: hypothetical protein MUO78_02590, partial [candidate division Zixibacteria bacterium]|nr:hypothetical protein [candidate division Zixibacteria bacterium]
MNFSKMKKRIIIIFLLSSFLLTCSCIKKREIKVESDKNIVDKIIRESILQEIPFLVNAPNSRPSNEFLSICARILKNHSGGDGLKD